MTKDEYKSLVVQSGKLTWDTICYDDLDFLYHDLHFIDSTIAYIFEVPFLCVRQKREELLFHLETEDFETLEGYKQQGYLKWSEVDYNRLSYLINKLALPNSMIADLFDVKIKQVQNRKKELGIGPFGSPGFLPPKNDMSSYLDFLSEEYTATQKL